MSSILTNTSAMVALQTLKSVNRGIGMVQSEISTGLKVSTAKDNASTWAIAQTMRSDVSGFKQVKDGLATALSGLGVGREATESISDLLKEMRSKIAAAGTVGADTAKIQTDINNLRENISSIVAAASFNGVNFVNSDDGASVLTSINRTNGTVATDDQYLAVAGVNLTAGTAGGARGGLAGSAGVVTGNDLASFSMAAGAAGAAASTLTIVDTNLVAGDTITVTIGDRTASYTLTANDVAAAATDDVVAVKLKAAIENLGLAGVTVNYDSAASGNLVLGNAGTGNVARAVVAQVIPIGTGGLSSLNTVDVSDETNRTAALGTIDTALNTVIEAAAALGSSQKRLEIQQDFTGKLIDSVNAGIGSLVDADMEEASARLQALQVQQQLGIQSLSIANQAPQNILALFR